MRGKWQELKLSDFGSLQRGLSYSSEQLKDSGVPLINLKSFDKGGGYRPEGLKRYVGPKLAPYRVRSGDLLIAITDLTRDAAIVGAPALAPDFGDTPVFFSMDVSRLDIDRAVADRRFMFYRMQREDVRSFMQARSGGSTVLHLHVRAVPDLRLELPPLPEQRRIAEILDTLDEAIRKTEQVIAKLQQMKQGLLHDLLTRGIDKNGELRDPERHPEQFKDSPLGRIPMQWDVFLLDNIAQRGSGHTPNKLRKDYWDGGIRWVSLADSNKLDNLWISETDKEISPAGLRNSSAVLHAPGTVILSRDAGVGRSAILGESMAVSQHFMAWKCGPSLRNMYLYYWLQKEKPRFEGIALGSTIPTIGLAFFRQYQIAIPRSLKEQVRIADTLLQAEERISRERGSLRKLTATKHGLMDDLLTGRVRVSIPEDAAA